MRFSLIGKKLTHSFSKEIHTKMGLEYDLVELEEQDVPAFIKNTDYKGFNVTIPYKEVAYKCCDKLDESALKVGAVNTIVKNDGNIKGYNTDVEGLRFCLKTKGVSVKDKTVLILGSGGAKKATLALCELDGAKEVFVCSRTGEINYSNVYEKAKSAEVLINCTPVGMYPNSNQRLVDLQKFPNLILVADCIYNPLYTLLLADAKRLRIPCVNGLSMLVAQALKAEEIWLNKKIDSSAIYQILKDLDNQKRNIVLVGMPSSGKSTVGKLLAQKLNKEFIDTDEVIESEYGSPAKIIEEKGEEYFRDIESAVVKKVGELNGKVIATGGGAILREDNRYLLKQNATVVYLERSLDKLSLFNRPISKKLGIDKLFKIRQPIYNEIADVKISNDDKVQNTVEEIIKFYENFSD